MRWASAGGLTIRGTVSAAFLAVACNGLLDNEERTVVANTSGNESGSGGTDSTTGSGGSASGEGGLAGMSAAGAAGVGDAGEAGESSGTGGVGGIGGVGGASTSSVTGDSNGTGEPCECTAGDSDPVPMQEACGKCGTATRTRVCGENCRWGAYGELGACTNEGVCTPNEAGEVTGHCDHGRWRFDTSTCNADCQWGPWTRGECEGDASRCSGCACVSWCTDPDTGGTTCKWIDCTEAEARVECEADIVATECTRKEPLTFIEWLPN